MFAAANKVCPAHFPEHISKQWPVVRVVVAQQGLVQFALFRVFDTVYRFALVADLFERIHGAEGRVHERSKISFSKMREFLRKKRFKVKIYRKRFHTVLVAEKERIKNERMYSCKDK